jgi:hypothetical protein
MRGTIAACVLSLIPLAGCQVAKGAGPPLAVAGKTAAAERAQTNGAEGGRRRAPEQVTVDLRVTRIGGGEALAVTRGDIETDTPVIFHTNRSGEPGEAKLSLEVEPRGRGVYAVAMRWDETTADGRSISWAPTLAVSDEAESQAEIAWSDGDGRRVTLKLSRKARPDAEVAHR